MTKPKRAVLYLRYSSVGQNEQSIEGQRTVCTEFAERNGIEIVDEYVDRARSASKATGKRTSFLKMIHDSSKGLFDTVLVYKLDRFARDRFDAVCYKRELAENGVSVISACETLGTGAQSILIESVLEGLNAYYSVELSEKIRRGINESVKKHRYLGGPVPFGMKVVDGRLTPDELTAPAIVEAFEMCAAGYSYVEIARSWEKQGFKSWKGQPFRPKSLVKMLKSKRYIGYYVYDDVEIPDCIEPIVSKELFEEVQRVMKTNNKRRKSHKDNNRFLLTGKLICGNCGEAMTGESGKSRNGTVHYYYSCHGKKGLKNGCTKKNIRKDVIESFVAQKAREQLTGGFISTLVNELSKVIDEYQSRESRIPMLTDHLKDVDSQLDNLIQLLSSGVKSKTIIEKVEALEDEKELLNQQISDEKARESNKIHKQDIVNYLIGLRENKINDDNALIATFIDKVVLFDPDDTGNSQIKIIYKLSDGNDKNSNTEQMFELRELRSTTGLKFEPFITQYGLFVAIYYVIRT